MERVEIDSVDVHGGAGRFGQRHAVGDGNAGAEGHVRRQRRVSGRADEAVVQRAAEERGGADVAGDARDVGRNVELDVDVLVRRLGPKASPQVGDVKVVEAGRPQPFDVGVAADEHGRVDDDFERVEQLGQVDVVEQRAVVDVQLVDSQSVGEAHRTGDGGADVGRCQDDVVEIQLVHVGAHDVAGRFDAVGPDRVLDHLLFYAIDVKAQAMGRLNSSGKELLDKLKSSAGRRRRRR